MSKEKVLMLDVMKVFKLPIEYNDKKQDLPESLVQDLEMIECVPESTERPIYQKLLGVTDNLYPFRESVLNRFAKSFTTDIAFLKDMQRLVKGTDQSLDDSENVESFWCVWAENRNEKDFKNKYSFVDWECIQWLNESETFLFLLSAYNISSPLISLLLPVLMLIVPFFILYLQGIELSFSRYIEILLEISEGNAVSRLLTNFSSCKMEERMYLIVSAGLYILSFYQNFVLCLKFCRNLRKINNELMIAKQYLYQTIAKMECMMDWTLTFNSFTLFRNELEKQQTRLRHLLTTFDGITEFSFYQHKVGELGNLMKIFYSLYEKEDVVNTIMYSFGFHGFFDILLSIRGCIKAEKLKSCHFTKKKKATKMKSLYYAGLLNEDSVVKNTVDLKNNLILTGPNASGKTTLLKAILLNAIFSQQFGYGCYSSFVCNPYHQFHCYLNICDNSGRDSLFQSESKKCQKIIQALNECPEQRHFCIFDELFSGTNPVEAVNCGFGFLVYLCKKRTSATFLLTTHYMELCKKMESIDQIDMYHMNVEQRDGSEMKYTYLISQGYNTVDGGVEVLKQLKFPDEILKTIQASF